MLTFELRAAQGASDQETAAEIVARVVDRLRVFALIPSLGGVESGLSLPVDNSHRKLTPRERREQGITDGLVRISCGIEDPHDLEHDLLQALSAL